MPAKQCQKDKIVTLLVLINNHKYSGIEQSHESFKFILEDGRESLIISCIISDYSLYQK